MQTERGIVYQFGPFEVNPGSGELLKNGKRIRLQELPHRLLVALLENPGEVISREELRSRLWPDDTFVDFDSSLRVGVSKLREALDDNADDPLYIETIPKRGYRFIGELEAPVLPVVPIVTVEPDRAAHGREMWLKIGAGVLAISVIALAAAVAYRWHRQQRPQEQAALTAVPFTALPGRATNPAFSPEGSRIAFAWNGDPPPGTRGFDLYVKALGGEALLRLTQHPSEWINPEWSPDGTRIAFKRVAGADTGIYVVPALGGPERKLRSTRVFDSSIAGESSISWSPDGKWIAFPDVVPEDKHTRIYLLSTETMETKQIPINPTCVGESMPAFSHNGEYLAYLCFRNGYEAQLFFLLLPGGKAKLIAPFWPIANGLTWSADDKKLLYSFWKGRGSDEVGEVTVANGSVKRFALEGSAEFPNVSPKGDKLAYASISLTSNLWRRDLLHSEAPAVELIRSSRAQYDAQYSPDGKHIAFASLRSGVQGVWISDEDGSNLVGISDRNYLSGNPQWSPDGRMVAF